MAGVRIVEGDRSIHAGGLEPEAAEDLRVRVQEVAPEVRVQIEPDVRTLPSCAARSGCTQPIAYIDRKGWLYCADHGSLRRLSVSARKLTAAELDTLRNGQPIAWRARA